MNSAPLPTSTSPEIAARIEAGRRIAQSMERAARVSTEQAEYVLRVGFPRSSCRDDVCPVVGSKTSRAVVLPDQSDQRDVGQDSVHPGDKPVETKYITAGPFACARPVSVARYAQFLTGGHNRQQGDVPSALRIRNTNRAKDYGRFLGDMRKSHGPLATLTHYPVHQPVDLAAAEVMTRELAERLGRGGDVLLVMRFDPSGRYHVHAAVPIGVLAGGCPYGCENATTPWRRTTWQQHKGGTEKGWACPTCGLTWNSAKSVEGWANYLGSLADELVWKDPERASGRWMIAVDKLGRFPRLSAYKAHPGSTSSLLPLMVAVAILTAPESSTATMKPCATPSLPLTHPRPGGVAQKRYLTGPGSQNAPTREREAECLTAPCFVSHN